MSADYRVLIAEDDYRTRRTIELMCRRHPAFETAEITQAENGLEAYDRILGTRPDVLILDMEMPGMTGTELLERLADTGIQLRVLIISGYDSYPYTHAAIRYGARDYLLKPISQKQFAVQMDEMAQQLATARAIEPSAEDRDAMHAVKEYVDRHYDEALSLSALAERFHFSREHLSREFKRRMGVGVTRYINDVRLDRARLLLGEGLSVAEVCTLVGFNDDSYFIRLFRQKYGTSPKKYS